MSNEDFAVREILPGQKDSQLIPVRCSNTDCGKNSGKAKLLGRYYAGTKAEVKCPRCGFMNRFKITIGRYSSVKVW